MLRLTQRRIIGQRFLATWTPDEDLTLQHTIRQHGQNWPRVASVVNHTPQECKQRYKDMLSSWRRDSPMDKERRLKNSRSLVVAAMGANGIVCLSKLGAAIYTGSSSLLAESVHSAMDLINQGLLFVGIRRSLQAPNALHPYGFHKEQYGFAIISAVGILFVGCGIPMYSGVSTIIQATPNIMDVTQLQVGLGVLSAALLSESYTARRAYVQVSANAKKNNMSLVQYCKEGSDSVAVQVLLEDSSSVLGSLIAAGCLTGSYYSHIHWLDPLGSCMIGGLLGTVAVFLIRRNLAMVLETSMPSSRVAILQRLVATDPVVESITDIKTSAISPESARFKAEIQFKASEVTRRYMQNHSISVANDLVQIKDMKNSTELEQYLIKFGSGVVEHLGDEIDRIEENIKDEVPEVKHVDLEVN